MSYTAAGDGQDFSAITQHYDVFVNAGVDDDVYKAAKDNQNISLSWKTMIMSTQSREMIRFLRNRWRRTMVMSTGPREMTMMSKDDQNLAAIAEDYDNVHMTVREIHDFAMIAVIVITFS